jgi:hypothetical protein
MYNGNRLNDTAEIAGRIWIRESQNFSDPFDPDPEHCPDLFHANLGKMARSFFTI